MEFYKLLIAFLALVPTNWALSMASSGTTSVSSSSSNHPGNDGSTKDSAAATLGALYRKSRQSRCVRCYDDRYGSDDYDYSRYRTRGGGYTGRTYDDRGASNWYYPSDRYDRYDDRVRYGSDRDYDRYYNSYGGGYYRDRNDDRYSTRTYDRYDRDRYDSRYSYDRSPSENRGYGYDNRDRYYSNDRYNDYYRGGDRYAERNRGGSSSGSNYDRYGFDDRYYSRYDYRNYRPWDETYRGQSGFDNSGRGYYFANERPGEYYNRPGPSTPGPNYLPRDPNERGGGYPDSRPGSSSPSSPSSSSSSSSSPGSSSSSSPSSSSSGSSSDYGNRPRDDVADNKNGGGYAGGSWSYVNDREKDTGYKGGIRDKDNQSSSYGSGGRGRPLGGSYLLDRDTNVPEESMMGNQDKPAADGQQMKDTPTASKLTAPSPSSTSTSTNDDRMAEAKDSK